MTSRESLPRDLLDDHVLVANGTLEVFDLGCKKSELSLVSFALGGEPSDGRDELGEGADLLLESSDLRGEEIHVE